jgi:hypothetical protein
MPFDYFVNPITTAAFQAIHLTPFLIGAYIAWRHVADSPPVNS